VVRVEEHPRPEPKDDEVLIQVIASTVSAGDWRARSLVMPPGFGPFARPVFGFSSPRQRILGMDLAGRIVSVGKSVTEWKVGDEVIAHAGMRMGCHAEFTVLKGDAVIVRKPPSISFVTAAALVFGAGTAWAFLNMAQLKPGERVLVNGASGAVGSAGVQLAKHFRAHVIAVSSQVDVVKELGADQVVDYTREDFTSWTAWARRRGHG
jgi:NADPH:quinone reductase-like Zn-dependent oxidoreductase